MPSIPVPPEVQVELTKYFDDNNATSETSKQNILTIMPLVSRWRAVALYGGFSTIVKRYTVDQNFNWEDHFSRRAMISFMDRHSTRDMDLICDLFDADRPAATCDLITVMNNAENEDIQALAAYMMCFVRFVHPSMLDSLRQAYLKTVGTACRTVTALALSQCGDGQYIKKLIQQNIAGKGATYYNSLIEHQIKQPTGLTREEIERNVALQLVIPEFFGPTYNSLLELILLDIASNGVAIKPTNPDAPPWVRKH